MPNPPSIHSIYGDRIDRDFTSVLKALNDYRIVGFKPLEEETPCAALNSFYPHVIQSYGSGTAGYRLVVVKNNDK